MIFVLPLLISACKAQVTPEAEVLVATFTSTPLLDMGELAERTYTPTATSMATNTETPIPLATMTTAPDTAVATPTPSQTPETAAANTPASLIAAAPAANHYFVIQDGAIVGMPAWAHQEASCAWLGVAGQVFDLTGNPVKNLVIEVGGALEGQPLLGLSLTGMVIIYGPGGYEIQLADHVVASQGEAWIQIKDGTGQTLSGKTYFETFADCAQNLLLINWVEVEEIPETYEVFLPLIVHGGSGQ